MRISPLLLLLLACSAPPRHHPQVPAPPVLDPVERVQRLRAFNLRGNVVPDVAVRVYADAACAGPVYLHTTGEALREGVPVELILGVDNVFSADAISGEGGVSDCSKPVVLELRPAEVPGTPSLSLTPTSPSNQRDFTLQGSIDGFARAQLHGYDCDSPVIEELDAPTFFSLGFQLVAPLNGSRTFAVDAVSYDQRSDCVQMMITNDSEPPVFGARLASPTPTSNDAGFIQLTGEQVFAYVYDGPLCSGAWVSYCGYCPGGTPLPPSSRELSVLGYDGAGNSTCSAVAKAWVFDGTVPLEQAIVLLPGTPPQVEVPVGVISVRLFDSNDCSGPVVQSQSPVVLVNTGLDLPRASVSGFVTARGQRSDGGLDPCSNAVPMR